MNWINNIRPKIRSLLTTKRELPDNLWVKCPDTGQMVFYKDLEANQFVIPGSNYHMRMDAHKRLQHLFDDGEFEIVPVRDVAQDPLKFRDGKRYSDRLKTIQGRHGAARRRARRRGHARGPGGRRRRPGLPLHGAARSAWPPARR